MTKTFVKLGDFIEPASIMKCGDFEYPVLSMTMHDGIVLQSEKFKKHIASSDKSNYKVVKKSQLVVGFPIDEGVLYIQNVVDAGIMSPAYNVWNIDSDKINPFFLEYCLHSPQAMNFYKNNIRGTTERRRTITSETLLNLPIPNVSFNKQEEYVSTLEEIKSLIDLGNKQLELFDELIKSRFVEMFCNKNLPLISLDDLSLGKGEYGAQSAAIEYNSNRPRYIRITDINEDGTLNDDYTSSENLTDDEKYKLSYGDFLFARIGATVGKTYYYKKGNQIYAGYLIRYKLNINRIIPVYLFTYTKLEDYNNWVKLNQRGSSQPGINAKKYGSLLKPTAPINEQNQFAAFVEEVEQTKVPLKQSLEWLNTLKNKLMQDYFG